MARFQKDHKRMPKLVLAKIVRKCCFLESKMCGQLNVLFLHTCIFLQTHRDISSVKILLYWFSSSQKMGPYKHQNYPAEHWIFI